MTRTLFNVRPDRSSLKISNLFGNNYRFLFKMKNKKRKIISDGPKPRSSESNSLSPVLDEVVETAAIGDSLEPFECPDFDANPPAQYRWLHTNNGQTTTIDNRNSDLSQGGRRLRLQNVGWSAEGEYKCVAYNVINGVRREMYSDVKFVLQVMGPPQIQEKDELENIKASISYSGERLHELRIKFCSRPPPRLVAWQWGSWHLQAGKFYFFSIPRVESGIELTVPQDIETPFVTSPLVH